jgi:hypothetical protein
VLAELGAALELKRSPRLANPALALRTSELFASLLTEDKWLTAQEIGAREAVVSAAKAQRLFALRRAAGVVLAKLETQVLADEAEARARYVAVMSRALGLTLAPEEGARWRLETDDFLRSATQLQAMRRAEQWRVRLGDEWWLRPLPPPE